MEFDRIHFYVENAMESRDWFIEKLGFKAIASQTSQHTHREIINRDKVYFALSSSIRLANPVADFLSLHPPGVADVAFRVGDIKSVVMRLKFCNLFRKIHKG